MGVEIERKFLVRDLAWQEGLTGTPYTQGYLAEVDGVVVRARLAGTKGKLTIKGPSHGVSRVEYEYEVPPEDVRDMLENVCTGGRVEKTRYAVVVGQHTWDVDVFHGANEGLVLAEIELGHPEEAFEMPTWAGDEVSHDPRFFNVYLARHPYTTWARDDQDA